MTDALTTLFLPFENGLIERPAGRVLFLNAQACTALKDFKNIDCQQPFYPYARDLRIVDVLSPAYDAVLLLASKDRIEVQYDLARALEVLPVGGVLVACAANNAGGARLEHWFEELGLQPQSYAKNKCRVVWATRGSDAITPFEWLLRGQPQQLDLGESVYWTQAGLFGWNKIDSGSAMLADYLPQDLMGHGADFGCGYGYLSDQLLRKNPGIHLTCIDADQRAVACCVKNCANVEGVWTDLTERWNGEPFDWVVMNPPFHMGKFTDSDIGAGFIKTAAESLKKGGRLYMVANRHLPYETVLSGLFSAVRLVADRNGFKVIFAQK